MKKYLIEAVYNTPEYAIESGTNYRQYITVWSDDIYNNDIHILVETHFYNVDENCVETEICEPEIDNLMVTGPFWALMYENIDTSYVGFHLYAVGHDGSHLTYMNIEFKGEIED